MLERVEAPAVAVDPITFSVILNRLGAIATEMTIALENAAMTPIIALCRDYSCCLYDSRARQIAMVDAIPIHTNSMHLMLEHIVDTFGDDIADGDVIACNYAYAGGTHIGDLLTVCPMFYGGEHRFWAAAKGHQLDVGAPIPHSANVFARDIWQEGLQIPPIKLYDAGRKREDVVNMYLTNVRWRDLVNGDLMAQLGSIWTGERRLREMCDEFGIDTVETCVQESIDYAARRTKEAIRAMPNGVYRAEGWLDDDAAGRRHVPIRCAVTIHDESVTVDFEGSAPQGGAGANASNAVMQAVGGVPIVSAIDPDIPHNEGCLRTVNVLAPLGSICNAEYPAATAFATVVPGDLMQDVVCRALASAIPDKVRAGTAHWANGPMFSGSSPESGAMWGHMVLNGGSGGGAADGADGWPLIMTAASHGGLKTASVEHTELLAPLQIEHWEIATDSMGLGEYIGGPGIECRVRPTWDDTELVGYNDGLTNPLFGVGGATPGRGGGHYITDDTGARYFLPGSVHMTVGPSETWTGESSGGGGYGDPLRRPLERVRQDVRDGFYSSALAAEVYGVVLSDAPDPMIDQAATATRRGEIEQSRAGRELPVVLPMEPGASTWLAETMHDGDVLLEAIAPGARLTDLTD